jgi:HK97 family phage prohead protease
MGEAGVTELDLEPGLDPAAVAAVCRRSITEHEAGHAAMAVVLGIPIERILVDDFEGTTLFDWSRASLGHDVDAEDLVRVVLAGAIAEGKAAPRWPLLPGMSRDEDALVALADYARLDRDGYRRLVNETHDLLLHPDFCTVERRLATALEHVPHLDAAAIEHLLTLHQKGADMATTRTKTTTAPVIAEELGEFEAIAAGYGIDRQNEQIRPGAFARTIEAWQRSGKRIPLQWHHDPAPESIIGSVDPASMRETADGLLVSGKLDITDSARAAEAWRSVKSRAVSLSFGFMVVQSHERKDGVTELTELDLFEITLTPAPANPETRVLSTKSVSTDAELRERAKAMGVDLDNYQRRHKVERRGDVRIASFEL